MMNRLTRYLAAAGAAAALALLAVGISTAAAGANKGHHGYKKPKFALRATLVIRSDEEHGKKGRDGKWHDAFLPASFRALKGVPVKVVVYNYDDMPHTFTSPSLHVNKTIKKGSETKPSKTTFTFKPKKTGKFLWWCALPCDPYAMVHTGLMRGYVRVVG